MKSRNLNKFLILRAAIVIFGIMVLSCVGSIKKDEKSKESSNQALTASKDLNTTNLANTQNPTASAIQSVDPAVQKKLNKVKNIIVIYDENRSFDNLYGYFPGANGIENALRENTYIQVDHDGKAFNTLPPVREEKGTESPSLPMFADNLPNKPFRIDAPPINFPISQATRDLVHRYYQSIEQIDGGKMDRFAAVSDANALTMGYYDGSKMKMWKWASNYVLADNFFMAAFGGSYLNHQWLICACTPFDPTAPQELRAKIDENNHLLRNPNSPRSAMDGPAQLMDGALTPDGYSVNTQQPAYQPSKYPPTPGGDPRYADPTKHPLPPQITKTIGDTLSDKNISWAWYAGGWNKAITDGMQDPKASREVIYKYGPNAINFQPHHQPFNYFKRFDPRDPNNPDKPNPERTLHLKDGEDFIKAIDKGTLPQVSFYKPYGAINMHPGYSNVLDGDQHLNEVLEHISKGPQWKNTVVIITYDDNGGFWDHVSPPKGDRWGPGVRLPAIIISPLVKRHYVDHTQYDTTSIIKFITRRYNLEPLPGVRASAGDFTNVLK